MEGASALITFRREKMSVKQNDEGNFSWETGNESEELAAGCFLVR